MNVVRMIVNSGNDDIAHRRDGVGKRKEYIKIRRSCRICTGAEWELIRMGCMGIEAATPCSPPNGESGAGVKEKASVLK
jgi:hypothetical protein